jgi:probable HAF family extracellular repeat protein
MRRKNAKSILMVVTIVLLCAAAQAQTYTVTDLGTLRHGSARVHGINAAGQAVGGSGHPHGEDTHAFLWQKQGGMRDLGILAGGDFSSAFAINDSGLVVGTSNTATKVHAFMWTVASGMRDLGTLAGTDSSQAYAVNNQGQIAGSSGMHAVIFDNSSGSIQDLGTLGGDASEAHAINNVGQVAGMSATADGHTHAFLWSKGTMQDLGTLASDTESRADHINDAGLVVGASSGSGGVRAFFWSPAQGMQAITALSGGDYAEAFGVNSQGEVVGVSAGALGARAFLWTAAGGLIDLNNVVPGLPADVVLTGAFSINDKGEIVAFGVRNPNINRHEKTETDSHIHAGPTRVFLLTPQ